MDFYGLGFMPWVNSLGFLFLGEMRVGVPRVEKSQSIHNVWVKSELGGLAPDCGVGFVLTVSGGKVFLGFGRVRCQGRNIFDMVLNDCVNMLHRFEENDKLRGTEPGINTVPFGAADAEGNSSGRSDWRAGWGDRYLDL